MDGGRLGGGGTKDSRDRGDRRNACCNQHRDLHHSGDLLHRREILGSKAPLVGAIAAVTRAGAGRLVVGPMNDERCTMNDARCTMNNVMNIRPLSVLLITTLFAACTVGPKYHRPSVSTPDVFRGTADPNAPPDAHSLADLKWFDVFKDPQLQDLVKTAFAQ